MKNRKFTKTLCSLVLALALALCCLPVAFAAENEITVDFSFYNGAVVIPKTEVTVYDGIAEEYGFTMSATDHNGVTIDGPTVFDAIVAAHKAYYGDDFTEETSGNYLSISYGFVTKAFGVKSSALGMCVNDVVPHDNVFVDAYNSYTGYSFDACVINEGDYVSIYTYQDKSYYADYYITLSDNEIKTVTGEEFTLSATGYSAMWYGCSKEDTITSQTYKLAGLDVYLTTDFKLYSKVGTLDENGEITLSFDNVGTVYLCVMGDFEDPYMGIVPTVANWCEVIIKEPEEPVYEDALYIPNRLDITVEANPDEGRIVLNFIMNFSDIKTDVPDKTESISFEINVSWFSKIIEFIAGLC